MSSCSVTLLPIATKILVICDKAATALQFKQVLRTREAISAAVFHERFPSLSAIARQPILLRKKYGAQVLICSEIGSEGRNFQFVSHLIMFDLPFNPYLLEQLIGRLDRIGQTQEIQVNVPYLENTTHALLVR
ncbi:MAG: helicase-related protein [Symbiopectobacterium sp.]